MFLYIICKMSKILESLKHFRKLKGVTQEELSKKTGIPQSHISKIENGNIDIRVSSLEEISRLLDMEVMLIPRTLVSVIEAMMYEKRPERPAWIPDEGEEE